MGFKGFGVNEGVEARVQEFEISGKYETKIRAGIRLRLIDRL